MCLFRLPLWDKPGEPSRHHQEAWIQVVLLFPAYSVKLCSLWDFEDPCISQSVFLILEQRPERAAIFLLSVTVWPEPLDTQSVLGGTGCVRC